MLLNTSVPEVVLPGIPTPYFAQVVSLLEQLSTIERLPPRSLEKLQMMQFERLVHHASRRSAFWKKRLEEAGWTVGKPVGRELLHRIPPLTRGDVQNHFLALRARPLPTGFGQTETFKTSGSTGRPVRVERNALNAAIFDAQTFRDHLWHSRNLQQKLGLLRTHREDRTVSNWSSVTAALCYGKNGNSVHRGSQGRDLLSHLDWLVEEKPDYLNINPTLAIALARMHIRHNYPRLTIHQIISTGGTVTDDARALCREAWGAEFTDRYSCEEIGYLALQCPKHTHYHAAETVIIEIVDSAGLPCAPGETGRVLVTSLLSFAMPLIRYDLGDMAVPGEDCDCGRTLPVIQRIIGREFNFAILPTGQWRVGMLQEKDWAKVAPVRDFRVTQVSLDTLDVEVVLIDPPLTELVQERAKTMLRNFFGYDFKINLRALDAIDWGPTDKLEPFRRMRGVGADLPF